MADRNLVRAWLRQADCDLVTSCDLLDTGGRIPEGRPMFELAHEQMIESAARRLLPATYPRPKWYAWTTE